MSEDYSQDRESHDGLVRVGRGTHVGPNLRVRWPEPDSYLTIGRYSDIGQDCTVYLGGTHRSDWFCQSRLYPGNRVGYCLGGSVTIGHDVWIAEDVTILSGVSIGRGTYVGCRSVVTKDLEPWSFYAGNPARYRHPRFPENTVKTLERLAWWDWPHETVLAAAELLLAGDLGNLLFWARHRGLYND